jgi:hypothetical protein
MKSQKAKDDDESFDGRFLTAADSVEIDKLLDAAAVSGRAWFPLMPTPFTSQLEPSNAVPTLLGSMHAGVKQ